jgi:flavin reductase (DIM6/NTAB) family NADH-FMN oxidoreductase RutF
MDHARAATSGAKPVPYGDSESRLPGIVPVPGVIVGRHRDDGCPITFECRAAAAVLAGGQCVVIGEAVHLSIEESPLDQSGFHMDLGQLGAIGRMGPIEYATIEQI